MKYQPLNDIEGLQFVPVGEGKRPLVKKWQTSTDKHDLDMPNRWGVGLVCGTPSGNVECIDIDLKYDLTGKLFDKYKRLVHGVDEKILPKLVVQKTISGGYHFVYRCQTIAGNTKLANRPTIPEEREHTYKTTLKHEIEVEGKDEVAAKKVAEKARDNDKVRVLIETRGVGGQFVCNPTPGYEFIFGDLCSISEISSEERDVLFGIAMQFNQVLEEIVIPKSRVEKTKGLSCFEDYNQRGDIIGLLQGHGWKVVGQKGKKTIFLRPGQTTSQSSGNFDHDKNWFSVFTTSTEFEPMTAYLPYAVFSILECNKDFSEASKKLFELGYGERNDPKEKQASTRVIPSRVNPEDDNYSFLATSGDYSPYLDKVRAGTLEMGKTTGFPTLDEHFLHKEGNLVMTNGIDNTGKSVFTWYLYLLAAMYHNWHGIIFSSENTIGAFMRKQIQFYWGKPLYGDFKMNDKEYEIAKAFIEQHFKIIKSEENLYNYKDIINMVKKARIKHPELNYGMIDPYNSLKIDLSGFSKLSTHEYHYEALSELKAYGQTNSFGWIINNHAVTSALRAKDNDRKYPVAPRKEDTEGGGKFANKADDFITIHRVTGHPTDWMVTEVHVRKIKDTETGGRSTPYDNPVKFEMYKGQCAFAERLEGGGRGIDPVQEWHYLKTGARQTKLELPKMSNWMPYKDDNNTDIGF